MSEHTGPDRQGGPNFRGWMGSMWLYTLLRFALFFALWGILLLAGLGGLVAAAVALLLSIPLSFVLLAVPRQRFAAQIEARVDAHREQRQRLDADLNTDLDTGLDTEHHDD